MDCKKLRVKKKRRERHQDTAASGSKVPKPISRSFRLKIKSAAGCAGPGNEGREETIVRVKRDDDDPNGRQNNGPAVRDKGVLNGVEEKDGGEERERGDDGRKEGGRGGEGASKPKWDRVRVRAKSLLVSFTGLPLERKLLPS